MQTIPTPQDDAQFLVKSDDLWPRCLSNSDLLVALSKALSTGAPISFHMCRAEAKRRGIQIVEIPETANPNV